MLKWAAWLFYAAVALLWVAVVTNLLFLWNKQQWVNRAAVIFSRVAWLTLLASLILRGLGLGYIPFLTLYDSLSGLIWVVLGIYLVLEWRLRWPVLGLIVLGTISLILSYVSQLPHEALPLSPMLQSRWLMLHVILNFISYGSFALSFALAILFLWQERQLKRKRVNFWYYWLPSLEQLEYLSDLLVQMAFPLLTLGIVTGAVYAENAWGAFWDWNVKETWSLITWLIYAGYLHARHIAGWRGKRAVVLSMLGFLAVLFNYFGVSLFLGSPHSFLRIL